MYGWRVESCTEGHLFVACVDKEAIYLFKHGGGGLEQPEDQ